MPGRPLARVLRALSANLRRRREAKGLTQAALAEAAGIQPRYLQQLEHGQAAPSLRRLIVLAECLDVDVIELLRPTAPMARQNPGRPKTR